MGTLSISTNGAQAIKTGIIRLLRAQWNTTNVELPTLIQDRPLPSTPEPYVYVRVEDEAEVHKTKTGASREYVVSIEVMTRSAHNSASTVLRDRIVTEITRILESVELDLSTVGYDVYIQNVENIFPLEPFEELGATYFKTNISFVVTVNFEGLPMPEQDPSFLFRDFTFSPHGRNIELHDAGIITPETTYPDSNGFTFDSAVFTLTMGADGMFDGTDYTVTATDDNLSLDSVLTYSMGTESVELTATNRFNRVRSLRYGASTNDTWTDDTAAVTGLQLLSNFQSAKRIIAFNNLSPIGDQIEFVGPPVAGDRLYIMYDATLPALTSLENINQPGGNDLHLFSSQILGGFRIYTQITPLYFDGELTYNIR